jgi:hypothetical protein
MKRTLEKLAPYMPAPSIYLYTAQEYQQGGLEVQQSHFEALGGH